MCFTCAGHLPSPKPYLISAYWPGEPPADARNAAVFEPKSPCVTAPTFGFSRAIFSLCIWRQSKAHLAARTWWKWTCRQVEVVSCVPERIPWVLQPSALGLGDHARGFLLPCGVRRKLIHICTWQLLAWTNFASNQRWRGSKRPTKTSLWYTFVPSVSKPSLGLSLSLVSSHLILCVCGWVGWWVGWWVHGCV